MLASALVAYLLGPGFGFTFALLLGPAHGVVFALLVTGRGAELEARTHARLDPWVDRVVSRAVEPLIGWTRRALRPTARFVRARLPAAMRAPGESTAFSQTLPPAPLPSR